ncbi:MAG TPA: extracellular solute-binding protein [Candidatus Rifleibacterium sp.]|nr:extracellular solute-binding protein [Candidatus Rifleibacterium sp.]
MRRILQFILVLMLILPGARAGAADELVFWNFWNPEFILPVIEKFEKAHPGVRIRNEQINWGNGLDKIVVALANGMAPDICELGSTWMGRFSAGGALLDLTDQVKDLAADYQMWEPVSRLGRIYGVPWLVSTRVLFYNRGLFKMAGLDPARPPQTWPELLDAARRMHDPARGIFGFGMNAGEGHVLYKKFMPFVWGNGGEILDKNGQFVFDSPATRAALEFYLKLSQFSYLEKQDLLDEAFKSGKIGLTVSGSWNFADFPKDAPALDFGVALLPKPAPDRGFSASFLGGQVLVLFKNCRNPALAVEFMRFLSLAENTMPITRKALVSFPAHRAAYRDPLFSDPRLAVFVEQMKTAVHPPLHPAWIEIEKVLNTAIEKAMYGTGVNLVFAEMALEVEQLRARGLLPSQSASQPPVAVDAPALSSGLPAVGLPIFLLALIGCGALLAALLGIFAVQRYRQPRTSADAAGPIIRSQRVLLFLSPWLVTFLVFWLYPLAFSLLLSLFDHDIFRPETAAFAGLKNYGRLFHDREFAQSFVNTLLFVIGTTPFTTILALILALMINSVRRGSQVFRSIFFLPSIVSIVVTATIFKSFYSPVGMLNRLMELFGLPGHAWLVEKGLALPAIMLMTIWAWTGYYMVLYLAAIKAVPRQLYEAAEVDGADEWQLFRYITLPQIHYMTIFILTVNTIRTWQVFPEVFTLTRGGPVGTTNTMVHHLYETAFRYHETGYASAISFVLLAVILGFSIVQMRILKGARQ